MRTLQTGTTDHKRVLLLLHYYDYRHHAGVARYAAHAGWALEDAFTQANELPAHWTGDGVISFHGNSQPFIDWLKAKAAGIPVVDMGDDPGESEFPRVTTDNDAIAAMAVDHFRAKGYHHVGFVWGAEGPAKRQRMRAVEAAAAARGMRFWNVPLDRIALLRAQEAFPIALLAANDAAAVRALRACEDAGVLVPEQAILMGVDNFTYRCEPASVSLSSIDADQERVGYEAAAMLDALMNGQPPERTLVRVPPVGIVERDSTDMFAVADVEVAKAMRFIALNSPHRVGLRDVARSTGISLRRLQTRFKENLGRTILQEINGRRVKHAKELLKDAAKKIRVVAGECGFGNAVKMIRIFKQYEGMSPKRFRRQIGGEPTETVRNGGRAD
jgi:LacI family transcriptional regulator